MPTYIHKYDADTYHLAVQTGPLTESACHVALATSRPKQSEIVLVDEPSAPVGKKPCWLCFDEVAEAESVVGPESVDTVEEPAARPDEFVCEICDDWSTISKGAHTRHMNSKH